MYRRSFVIPIIVFVLSSIGFILYQSHFDKGTHATQLEKHPLDLSESASQIVGIHYAWVDGAITAKREENNWQVTQPLKLAADASYIYHIVSEFTTPGRLHIFEGTIKDPSLYGIDSSSPSLTLYATEGITYEFIRGNVVDETFYYAYSPKDQRLYTVPCELFDSLSKNVNVWTSKDFFNFSKDTVSEIYFSFGNTKHQVTSTLLHDQHLFKSDTLPQESVDALINFLTSTKANAYVVHHAEPEIIKRYGFYDTSLRIVITTKDGSSETYLISTTFSDRDAHYVLIEGTGTILTIDSLNLNFN